MNLRLILAAVFIGAFPAIHNDSLSASPFKRQAGMGFDLRRSADFAGVYPFDDSFESVTFRYWITDRIAVEAYAGYSFFSRDEMHNGRLQRSEGQRIDTGARFYHSIKSTRNSSLFAGIGLGARVVDEGIEENEAGMTIDLLMGVELVPEFWKNIGINLMGGINYITYRSNMFGNLIDGFFQGGFRWYF